MGCRLTFPLGGLENQSSSTWRKTGWRARTWGSDESSLHPAITIVANERFAQPTPQPLSPPRQDLNRAVTVTGASLSSLQDCCQPKGSAVTYICQALLALPTSENHFSLNFIMAYLFVFSSIVWFELRAPSMGFAEGKLASQGWTLILCVISTGVLISGQDWFLSSSPAPFAFKAIKPNFPPKSSISRIILKSWKTCPTLNTNEWWNRVSCPESPVGYFPLHWFHVNVIWSCTLLKQMHASYQIYQPDFLIIP